MDLEALKKNWEELGRSDPFWAILSDPDKRAGGWDPVEFFATGEVEIAGVLDEIESETGPSPRRHALDFGCGAGRLSQALGDRFEQVTGVDIAASMIELARKFNRHGSRVRYILNEQPNLSLFDDDSFDWIYTSLVLQHMAPEYAKGYLREMIRVLAPGGRLVFQIPAAVEQQGPGRKLPRGAFRARLSLAETGLEIEARSVRHLQVLVRNESNHTWPAPGSPGTRYPVQLGNHWLDVDGTLRVQDDGRAGLPADLHCGEQIELDLLVTAPERPGRYLLELDLVQELVAWFADRGSTTLRLTVEVVGPAAGRTGEIAGAPAGDAEPPTIEMHAIPPGEVKQLIEKHGAELLEVKKNDAAGSSWISYRYCVSKR